MFKIAPSILSADFADLKTDFARLEEAGIEVFHLDVLDGHFGPNISFGPNQIKCMRKLTKGTFDAHLMITEPEKYIDKFVEAGCDVITVHQEATMHLQRTLRLIKDAGVKAGVALNPSTPLTSLEYILDDVDQILIMSVNPGFSGQKFIPAMMEKIKKTHTLIGERDIMLEVDGGVNLTNARALVEAGVDILVSGAYMFSGNAKENAENLYKAVYGGEQ